MSIESMMPSNHLILCHSLLLLPSIFPSIGFFSSELALHIRWPKYWSFKHQSFQWIFSVDFSQDWLGLSPRDSEESWSTPQFESINEKMLAPSKKRYDQPRQHIKKQRHYFANKGPFSQSYGFSSCHVWMWELDHKEGWMLKNQCFGTVVLLEKTLESLWDCKEFKPVSPKGNQS